MGAAHNMDVAVFLTLHPIVAKVRHQPEAAGTVLLAYSRSHPANPIHIAPELSLRSVSLLHGEEHNWNPAQEVLDHDDGIILVDNVRRFFPGYNVAEDAVLGGVHGGAAILGFSSGTFNVRNTEYQTSCRD